MNGSNLPPPRFWAYRYKGGEQWTATTCPPEGFRDKGESDIYETVGLWSLEDIAKATGQ